MSEEAPIYVDELFYAESRDPVAFRVGVKSGHKWCHLWSTDLERLHWMAERIGMRREWFQNRDGFPHYDLVPSKRRLAIAFGAKEKDLASWLREQRGPAMGKATTNRVGDGVGDDVEVVPTNTRMEQANLI